MSTFAWQGAPMVTKHVSSAYRTPLFMGLQTPTIRLGNIAVSGAEQHRADVDRRDALKRCISMAAEAA